MLNNPQIDETFRALAEPTRRALVERLSFGPATVSELARPFDMTLAAVVQHLQVLEACGVVRSEKVGRTRTCTLAPRALDLVADWITARRTALDRRLDRLGQVLNEMAATEEDKP